MAAPKKAVHVETERITYCPSCFSPQLHTDHFCGDCGTRLVDRLALVSRCECDPARDLVGPMPDPYNIPDPRLAALHPTRFCPQCGTSTEKLVAEWREEQAALAAAAAPRG